MKNKTNGWSIARKALYYSAKFAGIALSIGEDRAKESYLQIRNRFENGDIGYSKYVDEKSKIFD